MHPAVLDPLVVWPEMGAPVRRQRILLRHHVLDAVFVENIRIQWTLAAMVLERYQDMLGAQAAVQVGRLQRCLELLVGRETRGVALQQQLDPDVVEMLRTEQA